MRELFYVEKTRVDDCSLREFRYIGFVGRADARLLSLRQIDLDGFEIRCENRCPLARFALAKLAMIDTLGNEGLFLLKKLGLMSVLCVSFITLAMAEGPMPGCYPCGKLKVPESKSVTKTIARIHGAR